MTSTAIRRVSLGVVGGILAVMCARREFQFAVVTGESMSPTFHHGDLIIGRRHTGALARGDVVVFTIDRSDFEELGRRASWDAEAEPTGLNRRVKRIVAIAGERAPASLPRVLRERHGGRVPLRHIAVAGDSPNSQGSAQLGFIDVDRVESVVISRLRRRSYQTKIGCSSGPAVFALPDLLR